MRRANRAIFHTRFKFLIAPESECLLQPAKMVFIQPEKSYLNCPASFSPTNIYWSIDDLLKLVKINFETKNETTAHCYHFQGYFIAKVKRNKQQLSFKNASWMSDGILFIKRRTKSLCLLTDAIFTTRQDFNSTIKALKQ